MSANTNNQGPTGTNIVTIEGTPSSSAASASATYNKTDAQGNGSEPITITRRINVKIQGSMSDFAQDGQVIHGYDMVWYHIIPFSNILPIMIGIRHMDARRW